MAWGANAGYAINPARDFGPRLATFITGYETALCDQNGTSYFWLPIVAPIIGGLIGGALFKYLIERFLPTRPRRHGLRAHRRARSRPRPPTSTAPRTKESHMADFVGAVDQGTTSTRFMIFDHGGNEVGRHQLEHEQILPQAGWVEHNPVEIWERTSAVHPDRAEQGQPAAVATWPRWASPTSARPRWCGTSETGRPLYNAIVWQDTRTDRIASALDRDGRGDVIRQQGRPAAGHLLLRRQDPVDPGERRRGPRGRRARRRDLRQHRHLAAVEPHRRRRRRRARHRRRPTPAARC